MRNVFDLRTSASSWWRIGGPAPMSRSMETRRATIETKDTDVRAESRDQDRCETAEGEAPSICEVEQ